MYFQHCEYEKYWFNPNQPLTTVLRWFCVVLQYVNPAFEKMTGYWRSEVVGHPQTLGMNSEHDKPVSSETLKLVIHMHSLFFQYIFKQ